MGGKSRRRGTNGIGGNKGVCVCVCVCATNEEEVGRAEDVNKGGAEEEGGRGEGEMKSGSM